MNDYTCILQQDFYEQPTLSLAKNLLGKVLVHETDEGITSGVIVETEAYVGAMDEAAQSYQKRRTKRTGIMYHSPGHVYRYQLHGHHLSNVVPGEVGNPHAVVIRAIEPQQGIPLMKSRRPVDKLINLSN